MAADNSSDVEAQIDQWRSYLHHRQAIHATDVEELEVHLRDQVAELAGVGLHEDEAFLIAVKRMGNIDALSREFAREHSDRLWKQIVLAPSAEGKSGGSIRVEILVVVALAIAAALAIKVPELFGIKMFEGGEAAVGFYLRNVSLFVLPFLTGYFVWKRGLHAGRVWIGVLFASAAVFANVYAFSPEGSTEMLTFIHLPIALWLVVGFAYVAGDWRSSNRRMNFVRFSGELFIYYVLIALGGGVLTGFTLAMFEFIGLRLDWLAQSWIVPCGAIGAVIVGAFLVEAKQSVIENMAPVLTRVFSPLFAILLLAFLATMIWTGTGINVEREVLIGFDLLLVLVLGLLLYAVSARRPEAPPDAFDTLQLVLVVSALIVDVLALMAIAGRISEFGVSPNRIAALGLNIILLINLAWSAWLYFRFLRGNTRFAALERWQTSYLPVYGVWAVSVVVIFPPAFGYV